MKRKSMFAKSIMIAGIFTLGLTMQATAAEAGNKRERDHHEKRYKHSQYSKHNKHNKHDQRSHHYERADHHRYKKVERHHVAYQSGYRYEARYSGPSYRYTSHRRHNRFVIPTYISVSYAHDYQPYYYGDRYYRPHGHIHQVYRFPVYSDYGVDYRAVTYCNGSHYRSGQFVYNGPKLGFSIQF